MTRPFLPSDLPKTDPLKEWRLGLLVKAIADTSSFDAAQIARRLWPEQEAVRNRVVQRAVSRPAALSGWGSQLSGVGTNPLLASLRPKSAAARLFDEAEQISMAGVASVNVPRANSSFPLPSFVAEGDPIAVVQGTIDGAVLGPVRKLALIAALTGELSSYSAETAEAVIRLALEDAVGRGLDAAVFGNQAATDTRPAGLLNGVTAIAAASGGGLAAAVADVKNLVGAIADAGGGNNVAIYANPRQAVALSIYAPNMIYPIVPAAVLASGTLVAIEQGAIASGFEAEPEVTFSENAAVQFENAPTQQMAANGQFPNGASIRSAFQTDLLMMKVIQPCAWTVTAAGMVQTVTGASW